MNYLGDFKVDGDVYIDFNTYNSDGASVTLTGLAATDVEIYKNGGTTQRTSDNGITVTTDFDSVTGLHMVAIDLSDNSDAGFFAAGNDYTVAVASVTVDSQTVTFSASFSIENRFVRGTDNALLAASAPTNFGDMAITATTGKVTTGTNDDKTGYSISGTKTTLDALNDVSTAQVNAEADTALADYDAPTKAEMDAGFAALNDLSAADVNAQADTALVDFFTSSAQLVDDIWDEVLTGATHNVTNSAGRRLRQVEAAFVLHTGTAQAGGSNTITLDTGANANDDFYNHAKVVIAEGTGVEQERIIVDYDGTTKVATIAPPWVTNPDATSVFEVEPALAHAETGWGTIKVGTAAAATSTTITLDSNSSSVDDYYNNDLVHIDAGTGEGQVRVITDYNGTTKVATINAAWTTTPDTTSEYIVEEGHPFVDLALSSMNDISVTDILTTQMTEAYNTDGTAPSLAEFCFVVMQRLLDFAISGTTISVKKLDGTTEALTITLDSGTSPTSSSRAT